MGQYHFIYNKTKKEMLHPHKINCGLKLVEFTSPSMGLALGLLLANSNGRGSGDIMSNVEGDQEKINLIAGRWAGDSILVQGDYAEEDDKSFISEEELSTYTDISELVYEAVMTSDFMKFISKRAGE